MFQRSTLFKKSIPKSSYQTVKLSGSNTKLSNYLDQRLQSVKLTLTILNEWKMLNAHQEEKKKMTNKLAPYRSQFRQLQAHMQYNDYAKKTDLCIQNLHQNMSTLMPHFFFLTRTNNQQIKIHTALISFDDNLTGCTLLQSKLAVRSLTKKIKNII